MLKNIPKVLSSKELLDLCFRRASKIQIHDRNALYKKKKTIIAGIDSFTTDITSHLERYVKEFPSIEQLPMFYHDILSIKIDINKLKKSLGAVDWARKTCNKIYLKQVKSLRRSLDIDFLVAKQKEIYGRISSVVKQISKDLDVLSKAQAIISGLPEIQDLPTIVIAGYPNVGKSSLLRRLSSAKPEVAQYPFTTKEIHVGHIEKKERHVTKKYQVIDTPGLLDRPLSKRNNIEKQAIAALSNLADLIVFILDASETCGYSLEDQKSLLSKVKKMFNNAPMIIVENKADIKKTGLGDISLSCETGGGIDCLLEKIFHILDGK
ncbi:MAG: 50S ribosome-binding GTPase [Candidatus Thermoplasmatota archaeon]|jgi:nucleolar GTP-binding protein|nr:50S ribosome-binding GTPase [Candidatus Thermoplasmatota archaeon]